MHAPKAGHSGQPPGNPQAGPQKGHLRPPFNPGASQSVHAVYLSGTLFGRGSDPAKRRRVAAAGRCAAPQVALVSFPPPPPPRPLSALPSLAPPPPLPMSGAMESLRHRRLSHVAERLFEELDRGSEGIVRQVRAATDRPTAQRGRKAEGAREKRDGGAAGGSAFRSWLQTRLETEAQGAFSAASRTMTLSPSASARARHREWKRRWREREERRSERLPRDERHCAAEERRRLCCKTRASNARRL